MYVACEIIVAANAEKRGVGFEMDFCRFVRVVTGGEPSFKNGEVFAFQIQPESTFVLSARRRCCHDHTDEVARNREPGEQRGIFCSWSKLSAVASNWMPLVGACGLRLSAVTAFSGWAGGVVAVGVAKAAAQLLSNHRTEIYFKILSIVVSHVFFDDSYAVDGQWHCFHGMGCPSDTVQLMKHHKRTVGGFEMGLAIVEDEDGICCKLTCGVGEAQ